MSYKIASGKLLYNTGSQPAIFTDLQEWGGSVGGRLKREGTYGYIWLIHVVVQQKLTHYKVIILQLKFQKGKI